MDENEKQIKKKVIKKRKIRISKFTLYAIAVLVALFIVWQFVIVPMIVGNINTPPVGQIPVLKRGDVKFVDQQLSKRVLKNIPSLVPPKEDLGKENPFQ